MYKQLISALSVISDGTIFKNRRQILKHSSVLDRFIRQINTWKSKENRLDLVLIYVTLLLLWQQIVMSLWCHWAEKFGFEAIQKRIFPGLFFAVLLKCLSYYINKYIDINRHVLIFIIYFYFYRNSVLVGVQVVVLWWFVIFKIDTDCIYCLMWNCHFVYTSLQLLRTGNPSTIY